MFFICLFLSILIFFIKSPLRRDCYTSFSDPIINFRISHYNSSGPLYLFATILFWHHSTLRDNVPKMFYFEYHLKRMNGSRSNFLIFTTMGNDFNKLDLLVSLELGKYQNNIAIIHYTFYNGFKPGDYEMLDNNQNFARRVKVINDEGNYLNQTIEWCDHVNSYLKSISVKNSELCVITENNHATVLKPVYTSNISHGYITSFHVEIYQEEIIIGHKDYSAFECTKDESYVDKPIIFIIDGSEFNVKFYVINQQSRMKRFKLLDSIFDYVFNLRKISKEYKKVFLMTYKSYVRKCQDGSHPLYYIS